MKAPAYQDANQAADHLPAQLGLAREASVRVLWRPLCVVKTFMVATAAARTEGNVSGSLCTVNSPRAQILLLMSAPDGCQSRPGTQGTHSLLGRQSLPFGSERQATRERRSAVTAPRQDHSPPTWSGRSQSSPVLENQPAVCSGDGSRQPRGRGEQPRPEKGRGGAAAPETVTAAAAGCFTARGLGLTQGAGSKGSWRPCPR